VEGEGQHVPGAPAVASAYLFGSVAERRSHGESDLGLGVLLSWKEHPDRAQRFDVELDLDRVVEALDALGPVERSLEIAAELEASEG